MLNVTLIGDELHFRGHRVALLVESGVPASTMGDFVDNLEAGLLNQDERPDPCSCAHMRACPNYKAEDASNVDGASFDDFIKAIRPSVRGGLIKLTDLERIVKEVIEDREQE